MKTTTVNSPLGPLRVYADGGAIVGLYLPDHKGAPVLDATDAPDDPLLRSAAKQLSDYFAGRRRRFDLPLAPQGTPFQRDVWTALQAIPAGARVSYGTLAQRIGRPTAVRAVGAANGKNPISIVVPCHRVVGANGKLTGYAGGIAAKRWLLDHESTQKAHGR